MLSSCFKLKESTIVVSELNNATFSLLDGTYIEIIENQSFYTLADILCVNFQQKTTEYIKKGDTITSQLKMHSPSRLFINIHKNDSLIYSDIILGELKNNYFYLDKQKYNDTSEGVIIFYQEKNKSRLGILPNGDLTIDHINRFNIRLLYLPIDREDIYFKNKVYKRL